MENFITGYAGTESQQRRALRGVLGRRGLRALLRAVPVGVLHRRGCRVPRRASGLNSRAHPVQLPALRKTTTRRSRSSEEGFRLLDAVVDACARHGIYTILDLHAVPGAQNQHWHSDNPTQWAHFWTQRQFQDRVVNLWEAHRRSLSRQPVGRRATTRSTSRPMPTGSTIGPFYERLETAIRAVDPRAHPVPRRQPLLDPVRSARRPDAERVYTAHDYALPGFVDGGPYPGVSRGEFVDRDRIEETFLARTAYMRDTGTPIWVGEFGPGLHRRPRTRRRSAYRLLEDQLEIFERYDASWALWTYKDIGLQGVVTADPASRVHAPDRAGPREEGAARRGLLGFDR